MKIYGLHLSFLVLLSVIALACGSPKPILAGCGSVTPPNTTGTLQSISLCPATADARQYPNGQVQFTAIGTYDTQPSPVSPLNAQVWGACYQNAPTSAVTISKSGLAQCVAGSSGTYSVFAADMLPCLAIGPCGTGCFVTGYAQLTCP